MWINWWVSGSVFICKKQQMCIPFKKTLYDSGTIQLACLLAKSFFMMMSDQSGHESSLRPRLWHESHAAVADVTGSFCLITALYFLSKRYVPSPFLFFLHFLLLLFFFQHNLLHSTLWGRKCEFVSAEFLCWGFERKEFLQSTHPRSAQSFARREIISTSPREVSDNSRRLSFAAQRWRNTVSLIAEQSQETIK